MCIYVYTCMYMNMYIYICIYICMHTRVYIYNYMPRAGFVCVPHGTLPWSECAGPRYTPPRGPAHLAPARTPRRKLR